MKLILQFKGKLQSLDDSLKIRLTHPEHFYFCVDKFINEEEEVEEEDDDDDDDEIKGNNKVLLFYSTLNKREAHMMPKVKFQALYK